MQKRGGPTSRIGIESELIVAAVGPRVEVKFLCLLTCLASAFPSRHGGPHCCCLSCTAHPASRQSRPPPAGSRQPPGAYMDVIVKLMPSTDTGRTRSRRLC